MQAQSSVETTAAMAALIEQGLASPRNFDGIVPEFDKPAGVPCPHQSHKGCKVYARRPFGCRVWNCRWLTGDDTADLRRPDRSRYVIDIMPDFITMEHGNGATNIQVVQVWVDPKTPNAWRNDPALLAYLDRRGKDGIAALIRFNGSDAIAVFPPSMSDDGQWREQTGRSTGQHRGTELFAGLASSRKVKVGAA